MKKIIYLGGLYQAEYSLRIDFLENNVEMLFLIEENPFGIGYWNGTIHSTYKSYPFVKLIASGELEEFLKEYSPDVIIHRLYKSDHLMHYEAFEIAKRLGIPYVILKMETTGSDTLKDLDNYKSDIVLYTHDYDARLLQHLTQKIYFYSYGVSSFERSYLEIKKDRNIGTFGLFRGYTERIENIEMFLDGIITLGEKLHVYEASELSWKYVDKKYLPYLEIHPKFYQDETSYEMARYKIIVNIESLWHVEKMYSHKLFQSVGCGVPTLTFYKKSLESLFWESLNPVFVSNSDEVSRVIKYFLSHEEVRERNGFNGERFVHEKFSWFHRFDDIMKKENIWR